VLNLPRAGRWPAVLVLALLALVLHSPAHALTVDGFQARVHTDAQGKSLPYRLFVPRDYDPKQEYPLVIFLHGAGERGTDNRKQVMNLERIPFAHEANQRKNPCFVLAPQCPPESRWVEVDWGADAHVQPQQPSEPMRLLLELLPKLKLEFGIDSDRLYVTGLSMGGYGTWDLIARHPRLFAAAIPICGGADHETARRIAHVPVWAFHGDKDTVVKPERSRGIVEALKKAGGKPRYTEYPGVGHNSWDRAYAEPELMEWLFSKRLPTQE